MLTQPLFDKLAALRLEGMRAGLTQQLANPQYTELSFEERLGLLVDQEATVRQNANFQRRLKAARLHQGAAIAASYLARYFSCWVHAQRMMFMFGSHR